MSDIKELVTEYLKNYEPYETANQTSKIILNANEHHKNILNEELESELINIVKNINLNRYPDPLSEELIEAYAKHIGLKSENIIATVGSDDGIRVVCDTFLDAGDYAISAVPTFSMYNEIANLAKGKFVSIKSEREDLAPDINKIIEVANEKKAKIIFICSPNNPTGYIYQKEDIKKIIDGTNSIIVIDEAYIDFLKEDNLSLIDYSNKVVILRTMSKAYALAGIRVGFIISKPETMKYIKSARLPYNLSTLSQEIAILLIKNDNLVKDEIAKINKETARVKETLKQYKEIFVFESFANFILIRSEKANELYERCIEKGISLRDYPKHLNMVRITIGNKKENDEVIKMIKEVYDEK